MRNWPFGAPLNMETTATIGGVRHHDGIDSPLDTVVSAEARTLQVLPRPVGIP